MCADVPAQVVSTPSEAPRQRWTCRSCRQPTVWTRTKSILFNQDAPIRDRNQPGWIILLRWVPDDPGSLLRSRPARDHSGELGQGTLQNPPTQRFEQQSPSSVHGDRVGTQAWQVPPPSPATQWVEQQSPSVWQLPPNGLQVVPHAIPPSVCTHWPEQQSEPAVHEVPSARQSTQALPEHRPEQHSPGTVHGVVLPVAMQEAQCALSHTRPVQQGVPPSAPQAPPCPAHVWHWPATQDPLQHS